MHISAPGKLFLSGEWAVLELGNPGLVTAVDKRVHVEIEDSDEIIFNIDEANIKDVKAEFDGNELKLQEGLDEKAIDYLKFMKASIEATFKYLSEIKTFKIKSWGDLSQVTIDGEVKKVGFGSSAASVVATVGALLKFFGHDIEDYETRKKIYKLSAIVHYFAQGKVGSAFDVAASTFGGVFIYQRFDPKWLIEKMESGASVKDIVDQEWPSLQLEPLEIPEGFRLLVGWTKESASTSAMVKQLNEWAKTNQEDYKRLYDAIADTVKELIPNWKEKNKEEILRLLKKNEDILRELGQKSGVNIETPDLKKLSDLANENGGAGKLSGAGGGDCGIAICFDDETAKKITDSWKNAEFYVVDTTIDYNGVK